MLFCTNCLTEQSDPKATVCEACRMPGMLRRKGGDAIRPTQPLQEQPGQILLACRNCGAEIPPGRQTQCPHCQFPTVVAAPKAAAPTAPKPFAGEPRSDSYVPPTPQRHC